MFATAEMTQRYQLHAHIAVTSTLPMVMHAQPVELSQKDAWGGIDAIWTTSLPWCSGLAV
jgi:hypothetical protein